MAGGAADVGLFPSLVLNGAGRPRIAYYDNSVHELKYAYDDGTRWHVVVVGQGDVGQGCSLALDADNHPHISYVDSQNDLLKHVTYDGTAWRSEVVSGSGAVLPFTALAVTPDGCIYIAYYEGDHGRLRFARSHGNSSWWIEPVDSTDAAGPPVLAGMRYRA